VQKHVTLDRHNYGIDWFVLSDKFYKSLPADLLKVVTDAAQVACNEERKANRSFTANGNKTLAEKGVTVYTPTATEMAQFRVAAQPPVIEFLKTKIDPKLIDGIQAAVKDAEKK
jgi:TRAP-type C4-dicarboxylate transport system substrate-binding protein